MILEVFSNLNDSMILFYGSLWWGRSGRPPGLPPLENGMENLKLQESRNWARGGREGALWLGAGSTSRGALQLPDHGWGVRERMRHPQRRRAEILVDGEPKASVPLGIALVAEDDPGYLIQRATSSPAIQQLESTHTVGVWPKTQLSRRGSGLQGNVRLRLDPESFVTTKVLQGNKARLPSATPEPQDTQHPEAGSWVTWRLSVPFINQQTGVNYFSALWRTKQRKDLAGKPPGWETT